MESGYKQYLSNDFNIGKWQIERPVLSEQASFSSSKNTNHGSNGKGAFSFRSFTEDDKISPAAMLLFCLQGSIFNRYVTSLYGIYKCKTTFEQHKRYTAYGSGLILGLRPANERRRYHVTTSLISLVQA